jgi:hypothetical protein
MKLGGWLCGVLGTDRVVWEERLGWWLKVLYGRRCGAAFAKGFTTHN